VMTGRESVGTRLCDFCRQSNRKILVRGSNDDDRDICDECINQLAAAIKPKPKKK